MITDKYHKKGNVMTKEIDKEISEHTLSSYGWKLNEHIHSTIFTSHVIYIRDFRYDHHQLFSVAQKDFYSPDVVDSSPTGDYVNFIGQIMKKCAKNKPLNEIEKRGIAPVLINYIKHTKTFNAWRSMVPPDERLHMIMNIYHYKAAGNKDNIHLRPFIVKPSTLLLHSSDFIEYTKQVYQNDRVRNPQWFR